MKIWTGVLHKILMMFSREYREKYLCEMQTQVCIDNIVVMRSRDDHPRDVIVRWVEKYLDGYVYTDRQVIAKVLFSEQNMYLTELAVKIDSSLCALAVDQLLDAALAMHINDDTTGSSSSVIAIDFVASAHKIATHGSVVLTPKLFARMQSIISRAAYIALHLMPEDYPPMVYLKANAFHFHSE